MTTTVLETSNPDEILEYTGLILKEHTSNLQSWKILQTLDKDEMLFIEGQHQSTKSDEYIYHETFVHSLMCGLTNPKNVLILGGGEGCMIREVLKWPSVQNIRQVDWDSALVEYFKTDGWAWNGGAYSNQRVHVSCVEALGWLKTCRDLYDAIFIDLLDPEMEDLEFMKELILAAKERVAPNGGLSVNAGEVKAQPTPACALAKWMETEFTEPQFYRNAVHVDVPSYKGKWCFLMAEPRLWSRNLQMNTYPANLRLFSKEFAHKAYLWPRYYPDALQNFWKPTAKEYSGREKLVAGPIYDYGKDSGHYGC
jgi:predicted membrane-bound spermidine synthase